MCHRWPHKGIFSWSSGGAKASMNLCALGQLPKEVTSPRTQELMETASTRLASTICQPHPEAFQQSGF